MRTDLRLPPTVTAVLVRFAARSVSFDARVRYPPGPVIRLRALIRRGLRHPVLGPVLLVALCVLFALVALNATRDQHDAAVDLGALFLGLTTFLGLVLIVRLRRLAPPPVVPVRGERAPPASGTVAAAVAAAGVRAVTPPLRL